MNDTSISANPTLVQSTKFFVDVNKIVLHVLEGLGWVPTLRTNIRNTVIQCIPNTKPFSPVKDGSIAVFMAGIDLKLKE